ncbi:ACT domain-containing protein [Paraglaciecola sp. MB-3u-78]|uniref:ACT domain-containing protein n=1 Tax=Paraglaciecola sp. MB-3u-78 TaxID=2058332 RepID=UPI000C338015|nr:ACT domain-containing protein [Paraglaciecola sp. MB-3u-78]PKG97844.1 ribonuclease H [Paraglaciecola sp. MB-3u-78]
MSGETNLTKLIASMAPTLTENEYVFGILDNIDYTQLALLNPIGTFQEKEGLTIIVAKHKADEFNIAYSGVFKCITLNVHSSLDAVGLTAAVSNKLTQSNISANVVAAYYHDHVFIASKDAEKALAELNDLVQHGIED